MKYFLKYNCLSHHWTVESEGIFKLGEYSTNRVKAIKYVCTKCGKTKLKY